MNLSFSITKGAAAPTFSEGKTGKHEKRKHFLMSILVSSNQHYVPLCVNIFLFDIYCNCSAPKPIIHENIKKKQEHKKLLDGVEENVNYL